MKTLAICLSMLVMSNVSLAGSNLDLNRGSVLKCQGQEGELNRLGFRAKITTAKLADGGVAMTVDSEMSQCLVNASGAKEWSVLSKPEATNSFGLVKLRDLKLLVSSENGDLISSTKMNLKDSQTIKISADDVKKLDGLLLNVGVTGQQDLEINGSIVDQRPVFFGSYLIGNY